MLASSDLLQETLLVAVKKFAAISGRPRREALQWLNKLMQYQLLKCLRKHRRELVGTPVAVEAQASSRPALSRLVLKELREEVLGAISALPEPDRTVTVALYVEKQTVAEVAIRLGRTEGAVRAIHQRAVKRLRKTLAVPLDDSAATD